MGLALLQSISSRVQSQHSNAPEWLEYRVSLSAGVCLLHPALRRAAAAVPLQSDQTVTS
jgi:hypothetical protein